MNNEDQLRIHIKIAVAVSDSGAVKLAVADSNCVQERIKFQQMIDEIRADKSLWSLRYIKTTVPYPISSEEQP